MNKLTPGYPKDITGNVTFSSDLGLEIPEVNIYYEATINSKNERQVKSVSVMFSDRESNTDKFKDFCESRISVDFDSDQRACSITFYSITDLIDLETGAGKFNTSLEKYIEETQDIELYILMQIGLQFWGTLMDMFPLVDICGSLVKGTIDASNGEGGLSSEDQSDDQENNDKKDY